jgi:hypothetical protein
MLPLLLALALTPLDVVLRVDPAGYAAPLEAELTFSAAGKGVVTFQGRCPWPDPRKPLVYRWKDALALEDGPVTVRNLRYVLKDASGAPAGSLGKDPAGTFHPAGLKGLVFHLAPGPSGLRGMEHRFEREFKVRNP